MDNLYSKRPNLILGFHGCDKLIAEKVIKRVNDSKDWKKPVVTELKSANIFWRAEANHQKYLEKYPNGYTCHLRRPYKF